MTDPVTSYTTCVSKSKSRRHKKKLRFKTLTPYYLEPPNQNIIDIPTLFKIWPDLIAEIVKHVGQYRYIDLLQLRLTCVCFLVHCDKEIVKRQSIQTMPPSYSQLKAVYQDRSYFKESYLSPRTFEMYVSKYYHYKRRVKRQNFNCQYVHYGTHQEFVHDPCCNCCIYRCYHYYDDILILETESDVLLNPKIRLSLLNYNGR